MKSTAILGGVILAMGAEAVLSSLPLFPINWALFFIHLALLVLIVWSAQLLVSLENIYENMNEDELLPGDMPHLWIIVSFTGCIYLMCSYNSNYYQLLYITSFTIMLDIFSCFLELRFSKNQLLRETSRNWLIRDIFLFVPLGVFGWLIYFGYDVFIKDIPSVWSGAFYFFAVVVGYLFDMLVNYKFYGTSNLRNKTGNIVHSFRSRKFGNG